MSYLSNETRRPMKALAHPVDARRGRPSVRESVEQIVRKTTLLVNKEVELAKTELKANLKSEVAMVVGLGIAGVCAVLVIGMLLVALVFALAESEAMSGWAASLLVAGIMLVVGAIAGLIGWAKRVRTPLATTRRTLEENLQWMKDRVASIRR